jgi:hypothetical protein
MPTMLLTIGPFFCRSLPSGKFVDQENL